MGFKEHQLVRQSARITKSLTRLSLGNNNSPEYFEKMARNLFKKHAIRDSNFRYYVTELIALTNKSKLFPDDKYILVNRKKYDTKNERVIAFDRMKIVKKDFRDKFCYD